MIFGIGLPKTGITSLTEALRQLGYNAVKAEPEKCLDKHGMLVTSYVNQFEAVTDTPITYVWKEVVFRYPKAMYILTIRDPDSWLNSCRHWFSYDNMKDVEPYRELHQRLLGNWHFDAGKYRIAYFMHSSSVHDRFKGQANLLVMDVCGGQGWQDLCLFLGKEIPNVPFPHLNKKEE